MMSQTIFKWFESERLIHSIKTTIACTCGILLASIVGRVAAAQWIVITIIVVMCAQIYVGSVLNKAYVRFLGTFIGCLLAIFVLIIFGHNDITILATVGIASFIFSYIASGTNESMMYAGTLGAVTTTIIMLGQHPTITYAIERFSEISIGILIATLVSQFILPIHARSHLQATQAKTFKKLTEYYIACMVLKDENSETISPISYNELDESIIKLLSQQRQLAKQANREPLGQSFDPKHFIQLLQCEKEILRAIDYLHQALEHIGHLKDTIFQSSALQCFDQGILHSLDVLTKAIEDAPLKIEDMVIVIPTASILKQAITDLTQLSQQDLLYLNGFLFSAFMLENSLIKLAKLYGLRIKAYDIDQGSLAN